MSKRTKMVVIIIMSSVLFGIASFILLAKFYPPLNRKLFGEEFEISSDDIRFWVNKVSERNYYRVRAKYLKDPDNLMQWGGHWVFFGDEERIGGSAIVYNAKDNKIYGGGRGGDPKREWELYCLGEGEIKGEVFKPIFPMGTKSTFLTAGSLVITDAPAYYITIHLPGTLKKVEKEELEKGILAEIVEDIKKK